MLSFKEKEILVIVIALTTVQNQSAPMTTKERQAIEVAKLEAELNALKVDAKKVRRGVFDVSI